MLHAQFSTGDHFFEFGLKKKLQRESERDRERKGWREKEKEREKEGQWVRERERAIETTIIIN